MVLYLRKALYLGVALGSILGGFSFLDSIFESGFSFESGFTFECLSLIWSLIEMFELRDNQSQRFVIKVIINF